MRPKDSSLSQFEVDPAAVPTNCLERVEEQAQMEANKKLAQEAWLTWSFSLCRFMLSLAALDPNDPAHSPDSTSKSCNSSRPTGKRV